MQGVFPFQRRGDASVSIVTTITLSTAVTLQLSGFVVMEIANVSATAAAAFCITPSGASAATAATAAMRTIPPLAVLHERVMAGASFVSAIALTGTPTLVFTPGVQNG